VLGKNQKAALTEALLSIGDLKNAMKMLQKYPFFTTAYEDIGKLFCFYVQIMIDPIYSQYVVFQFKL
jgi:hypothetical protein